MLVLVAILVLIIGVSLGATGYGGFIVPMLLVVLLEMDARTAVAHGLASFVLPGLLGAWLYWRRRNRPSWKLIGLLCLGTAPGVGLGRAASLALDDRLLTVLVALVVAAAGAWLLIRRRSPAPAYGKPRAQRPLVTGLVLAAGVTAGMISVVAGVGGPLVTVPVLLALGLELGAVVGAALASSVFNVVLAAGALTDVVQFDWRILVVITAAQLIGIPVGAWVHGKIGNRLEPVIAVVAVGSGCWLMAQVLF